MTKDTNGGRHQPPALADLAAARTDYQDVPVESLGGMSLRLYALSGTDRAELMSDMSDLADLDEKQDKLPPATVKRVFLFQIRVVAESLGYPEAEWDRVGGTLGEKAIDQLFAVASDLSGLGAKSQDEAVQRLRPKRNAASGTG